MTDKYMKTAEFEYCGDCCLCELAKAISPEHYTLLLASNGLEEIIVAAIETINELRERLSAPAVGEGWQWVPKEPTPEMLDAAWRDVTRDLTKDDPARLWYSKIWWAMLTTAPKPEPTPPAPAVGEGSKYNALLAIYDRITEVDPDMKDALLTYFRGKVIEAIGANPLRPPTPIVGAIKEFERHD